MYVVITLSFNSYVFNCFPLQQIEQIKGEPAVCNRPIENGERKKEYFARNVIIKRKPANCQLGGQFMIAYPTTTTAPCSNSFNFIFIYHCFTI